MIEEAAVCWMEAASVRRLDVRGVDHASFVWLWWRGVSCWSGAAASRGEATAGERSDSTDRAVPATTGTPAIVAVGVIVQQPTDTTSS